MGKGPKCQFAEVCRVSILGIVSLALRRYRLIEIELRYGELLSLLLVVMLLTIIVMLFLLLLSEVLLSRI